MMQCSNTAADDEDLCDGDGGGDGLQIFDIKNPSIFAFDDSLSGALDCIDMTSLSSLLLISEREFESSIIPDAKSPHWLEAPNRLSLAYENLTTVPKAILYQFSSHIEMLDISHNSFSNLDFLSEFPKLTTLVCDHNNITASTVIPHMPKLELLWLNHCKIAELYPWARILRASCPNLRHLSLMGNSAAPSYLNGGTFYEYLQYRLFIISLFPDLVHLDDRVVTEEQRQEAFRLYKRPLLERITSQQHIPVYLRSVTDKMFNVFQPSTHPFSEPRERNIIV